MVRPLLIAPLVALGLAAAAPQAPEQPVFSERTDLVVLHVLVTDRRGGYVTGLGADAFTVLEDGRRQAVAFFGAEDAPVTVGLLIDSSGSMQPVRERVIAAATAFAEASNPEDELFALTFNDDVRPVLPADAPFTGDAATLRAALTAGFDTVGRTALHDAIAAGLGYLTRGRHQGKVLVIVSDGGDNASAASFDDVVRAAQASNTVIYTLAVIDPVDRSARPKRLARLAEASGGEAFEPRSIAQADEMLRRIARDIRHTYTIGYVPPEVRDAGRLRRIRVQAKTPAGDGLRVRTRQAYAAGP
jgi:Ca-activated chloride channel family protein